MPTYLPNMYGCTRHKYRHLAMDRQKSEKRNLILNTYTWLVRIFILFQYRERSIISIFHVLVITFYFVHNKKRLETNQPKQETALLISNWYCFPLAQSFQLVSERSQPSFTILDLTAVSGTDRKILWTQLLPTLRLYRLLTGQAPSKFRDTIKSLSN